MGTFSEQLKEKYGQGGSNTTPVEETSTGTFSSTLLNQYYNSNPSATITNSNAPVTQSSTSTEAKNLDWILSATDDELSSELANNSEAYSPKTYTDEQIISAYEGLKSNNLLSRIFNKNKSLEYDRKQALYPVYQQAKYRETAAWMNDKGITSDMVLPALNNNNPNAISKIRRELQEKYGLTQDQVNAAVDYVDALQKGEIEQKVSDYAGQNWGTGAVATLGSFLSAPIEATADTVGAGINYALGNPISKTTANVTQNIRDTVSEDMGVVGKTLYGAGTSIGDMLIAAATGGGGTLMGIEKASQVIQSATERGLTPKQIMAEGVLSGLTTAITEGKVFESFGESMLGGLTAGAGDSVAKGIVKSALKGFFAEGGQEVAEGVLDYVVDQVVANLLAKENKTEANQKYNYYISQGKTYAESKRAVALEYLTSAITDFIAGGLAGGLMSGGAYSIGAAQNYANINGNDINLGNLTDVSPEEQAKIDAIAKQVQDRDIANRIAEEQKANEVPNLTELLAQANQIPNVNAEQNVEQTPVELPQTNDADARAYVDRLFALNEQLSNAEGRLTEFDRQAKIPKAEDLPDINTDGMDVETDAEIPFFNPNENPVKKDSALPPILDPTIAEIEAERETNMPVARESEYNGKSIPKEYKEFNDTINSMVNMIGGAEGKVYKQNLYSLINEYMATKNPELFAQIVDTVKSLEKKMTGSTYTNKKTNKRGTKQTSYTYPTNWGTITEVVDSLLETIDPNAYLQYKATTNSSISVGESQNNVVDFISKNGNEATWKAYNDFLTDLAEAQESLRNNVTLEENPDVYTRPLDDIEEIGKTLPAEKQTELYGLMDMMYSEALKSVEAQNVAPNTETEIPTISNVEETPTVSRESIVDEISKLKTEIARERLNAGDGAEYKWNPVAFDKKGGKKNTTKSTKSTKSTKTTSADIPRVMAEDTGIGNTSTDVETELPDGTLSLETTVPLEPQGDEYVSQTVANTVVNGTLADDIPGAAQITEKMDEGMFNQTRISNDKSVKEARELLSTEDGKQEVLSVLKSKNAEITGVYVDATMQMLEQERLKQADAENPDYTEFNKLAKLISDKMHNVGQSLQALAKYTRTATGSIMQAQKLRDTYTDEYFGKKKDGTFRNQDAKNKCKKLADALANMNKDKGDTKAKEPISHEELVKRVKNTFTEKHTNLTDGFIDEDYEYIARKIEGGISTSELTTMLEQRVATQTWGLTNDDIKTIVDLFNKADAAGINSREASELLKQAYTIEAQAIGGQTLMDKWNAWRYFAMLGNPRTHIRNVLGNMLFGTVTDVKDSVVAMIEDVYAENHPEYQRTTSIATKRTDPELFEAASADFEKEGFGLATDGSKYDMRTEIERNRPTDFPVVGKIIDINSDILEWEDNTAIKRKYVKSLASYLKANGMNADVLTSTDEADIEFCKKAREYAVAQAQEATFHEESAVANLLNSFSRNLREKGGVGGFVGETVLESMIPFKKTPANIIKSGLEYSPGGFIEAIYHAGTGAEANTIINDLAKGMTGSSIMALGWLLSSLGLISGSNDDDDSKAMGDQEYSIKTKHGTYTIDWMAPAALPLFVGVEVQKWLGGDKKLLDAISSITEPIVELSMLQGIKNSMRSLAYGIQNENSTELANAAITFGTGYATQGVPTLLGQISRAADPYRRSTYSDKTGVAGSLDYQLEKLRNKLPGSTLNEAYIDEWGNKQENPGLFNNMIIPALSVLFGFDYEPGKSNFADRFLYNTISPGYYQNNERTDAEAEIERLSNAQDEVKGMYPSSPSKTYKNERIDEKTYEKLSVSAGQYTTDAINTLINSDDYSALSDVDKANVINSLESLSQAFARKDVLGEKIEESNSYKKVYDIYQNKGWDGVVAYYTTKEYISSKTNKSTKSRDYIPVLDEIDFLTDYEKGEYLSDYITEVAKYAQPFEEAGDYESLYQYYSIRQGAKMIDAATEDDEKFNKENLIKYLKSSDLAIEDRVKWFKTFYPDAKEVPALW